jgi:hypothetical protein
MTLRAPAVLVLVLAAGALASCGKSSLSSPRSTASTASAPKRGSTGKGTNKASNVAHARAVAYARAINLTAADVPGFTPTPKRKGNSASDRRFEHQMMSCAGLSGTAQAVLEEGSKSFELKHGVIDLSVSSEVTVESSPAAAQTARGALAGAHVRGCVARYLEKSLQGEAPSGATIGGVTIEAGTPPAPGTGGGFGWRVTASFDVHGVKVPMYLDVLGFVDGPSQVALLSSSILRPFPAEAQQRLYTLLLARAKAHAL